MPIKDRYICIYVSGDRVDINVAYNKTESSDEGYLDYLILNVRRRLAMTNNVLFFRDASITGSGVIAQYHVENCNSQTEYGT